ncbi:hypothetical protein GCM10011515_25660 [Tsuneonella deserti]|uniref:HTH marR-type domain-containing protein n=1 Tax=Tsuneonella deserti TaxID=2035528 RepID=A0ABQ1SAS1_9SPHN|nr:MarR family transcriptional regulator [Tsuneonella deserti]GGE04957.1 hypothetical protein GCM10011515_25660 [Tsuneonella deserti]
MHDDFLQTTGSAFLAHRLKRLSDHLVAEIGRVIERLGLEVPPTAGSTLLLLSQEQRLGIVEIAERLRVTHPFIVRLAARLEQLGLVAIQADKEDLRRKWVSLTEAGSKEAVRLKELNAALERVFGEIGRETGADLLGAIDLYEAALAAAPLAGRIERQLSSGDDQ